MTHLIVIGNPDLLNADQNKASVMSFLPVSGQT